MLPLLFGLALSGYGGSKAMVALGLISTIASLSKSTTEVKTMAFVNNNAPAASNNAGATTANARNQEKALSFINIGLTTTTGNKKLVSVPLNASKQLEKAVHDLLVAHGEEGLERLKSGIVLSFNVNNSDAPVELAF